VAPAAAGVCDEQVGGVFLTTVHDFVAVLVPFEYVTDNALSPALSEDDAIAWVFETAPSVALFNVQLGVQVASFTAVINEVTVLPTLETRTEDALLGFAVVIKQSF
jgi:hypothetical protein